jgi:hypothetical protein
MLYKYRVYYFGFKVVTTTIIILNPLIDITLLLIYNSLSFITNLKLINLDLLLQT